jgi:DNA-binding MarR family transcriptional regulator
MQQDKPDRSDLGFEPNQFQYLYYFHCQKKNKREITDAFDAMDDLRISRATAYRHMAALESKGYCVKKGGAYMLTKAGRKAVAVADRLLGNLMFWFMADFGYGEDGARVHALGMIFRQPVSLTTRIANFQATRIAILRAGGPAGGALSALPHGRHEAAFFVYRPGSKMISPADRCFRRPAVFVSDAGGCALELRAAHTAEAPAGGRVLERLWYFADGGFAETFALAGRLHIRGDAVEAGAAGDEIVGRVRIRARFSADGGETEEAEAEIVVYFGRDVRGKMTGRKFFRE